MNKNLPLNSIIELSDDKKEITIPFKRNAMIKFFIIPFIIFWLFGWFFGFIGALTKILSGNADAFLYFWFVAWTIGGIFAIQFLYRMIKKNPPEKITLNETSITYNTGLPPFSFSFFSMFDMKEYMKNLAPKQKTYKFTKEEISTLMLREGGFHNRLTVDYQSERIDIGKTLSEIEREWLYQNITEHYS